MPDCRRIVYVLRSEIDPSRYYVGLTSDLRTRIETHNSGGSVHTAANRPWQLVASGTAGRGDNALCESYAASGSRPRSGRIIRASFQGVSQPVCAVAEYSLPRNSDRQLTNRAPWPASCASCRGSLIACTPQSVFTRNRDRLSDRVVRRRTGCSEAQSIRSMIERLRVGSVLPCAHEETASGRGP
jgi:putative endonuclease